MEELDKYYGELRTIIENKKQNAPIILGLEEDIKKINDENSELSAAIYRMNNKESLEYKMSLKEYEANEKKVEDYINKKEEMELTVKKDLANVRNKIENEISDKENKLKNMQEVYLKNAKDKLEREEKRLTELEETNDYSEIEHTKQVIEQQKIGLENIEKGSLELFKEIKQMKEFVSKIVYDDIEKLEEQLPKKEKPDPTKTTPDPTKTTPDPRKTTPDPTKTTPDPTKTTPDPTKTTPDPTKTTPDPTKITPDPTKTTPDPTKTTPDPTKTTPDPTKTTPDPTKTTPDPKHIDWVKEAREKLDKFFEKNGIDNYKDTELYRELNSKINTAEMAYNKAEEEIRSTTLNEDFKKAYKTMKEVNLEYLKKTPEKKIQDYVQDKINVCKGFEEDNKRIELLGKAVQNLTKVNLLSVLSKEQMEEINNISKKSKNKEKPEQENEQEEKESLKYKNNNLPVKKENIFKKAFKKIFKKTATYLMWKKDVENLKLEDFADAIQSPYDIKNNINNSNLITKRQKQKLSTLLESKFPNKIKRGELSEDEKELKKAMQKREKYNEYIKNKEDKMKEEGKTVIHGSEQYRKSIRVSDEVIENIKKIQEEKRNKPKTREEIIAINKIKENQIITKDATALEDLIK